VFALNRKFFGKPNGTTAPPKQSKLAFSTKSSKHNITNNADEEDLEESASVEEDSAKENQEEIASSAKVKHEAVSPNGHG
jgi:DNA ligase 1